MTPKAQRKAMTMEEKLTCSASLKLWVRMYSIPMYKVGKWHLESKRINIQPGNWKNQWS